jgi:hypothetical protein
MSIAAQMHPTALKRMSTNERGNRLMELATELYDGWDQNRIAKDMRVHERTVRRWFSNPGRVPVVVLIALGAMVAVKRAEFLTKVISA